MSPITNAQVLFKSIPEGFPVPGKTTVYDTSETIDPDTVLLDGGLLIKLLDVSIDPYLRGRMRDASKESYVPAFEMGKPLVSLGVGVVVRSENAKIKAGDHIHGMLEMKNYMVIKDVSQYEVIHNPAKLPWSTFVGVLGMPGKTAFMAWKEYSHAKKGEIAFVTAGAGPVGSLVIQLAKMDGLKVIASAGSEEKVKFMKDLGADVAFNYKTTNTAEVLKKEGPIDVYWDNVGGETLEAALDAANFHARFIECGMISGYNSTTGVPVRNLMNVIAKSISMNGFIIFSLEAKHKEEFTEVFPPLVTSGKIKHKEEVWNGLDKAGDMILAVQKGTNKAKAVIHVADD